MIGLLLVAQLAIVAHASDTATSCVPVAITVAARAPGAIAPRISLPASSTLQLLRESSTSRMEPDGAGNPFSVTEATFLVAVNGTGRVRLPEITARAGALHVSSAPLMLNVHERPADFDAPQVLVRARLDDGRGAVTAETLYVGQQVDYVVDVLLDAVARQRLRRNPTFFPPDMPAVLAYDVEPPHAPGHSGRACFESLTYRRALFPLFPGHTAIPPAALTYALPVSASFFSREETHELHTDSVQITAIDPPVNGRPADFTGAVGTLRASTRLGSGSARMGDPLVFTLRVEGTGNVKLLPRPPLAVAWAALATGPERVEVDTSHARVTGAKEFDWLLTPRVAGKQEVPALRYPYFDPARATYELAITPASEVDVAAAALVSADTVPTPRMPIRRTLRAEKSAPLTDGPSYWLLLALAPVPATLRRVFRVRRRHAPHLTAARRLERASRSQSRVVARELRRLFLDALRERVPGLRPATARTPLARQLRRAGVTDATAFAAEQLLDRLDTAAFSGVENVEPGTVSDAVRVAREVDSQAVHGAVRTVGPSMLAILAIVVAGSVLLALPDGVARTFDDGVKAYDDGNMALAQRQFARAATRAPRAVDAWANLGTAAWARGDTAEAMAGWQRALRLDPLDDESRERITEIGSANAVSSRGYVPPVSVEIVAGAALLLWGVAWLALTLPPTRRPAFVRPVAGGAIVVALVGLAGALELHDRLDARGLGVMRRSLALSDTPSVTATSAGPVAIGEVGMLGPREGAWVRLSLDGARAGWVPTTAVLPLEDASSN